MKSRSPKSPKSQSAASPGSAEASSPRPRIGTALGNQTLSRLLANGAVSQPGDPQEKEADRIADAVTSASLEGEGERPVLPSLHAPSTLSGIGPGRPLDPEARALLEPRFGRDLGAVRVHDGPEAAEAARAAEARAFTVGKDVVFSPGQYAPGTPGGQRLLAHELAHVVQQSAAGSPPVVQRSPYDVNRPAPQPPAATVPPEILEIRPEEPLEGNPKIEMIAGQAKASLRLSPDGTIKVDAFWNLSSNPAVQGRGVRFAEAKERAEAAKAALVKLGVPAKIIVTGTLSSELLSDPAGSPGGLVRISHYPTGRPSSILPPVPPPRISPGLQPSLAPPLAPRKPPATPASPLPSTPPKAPGEEEPVREGEAGDVVKAFLAIPFIKKALEKAQQDAQAKAEKVWKKLPPGGKAALITGLVSIAAGATAGLASQPEAAKELLKKMNGVDIPLPIPKVPGEFKFQVVFEDEPKKFDPHAQFPPKKPADLEGRGAMLKWEIKF